MKVILIAPLIDEITYKNIQKKESITNPGQKFYDLLYAGLINNNMETKVYSFIKEDYTKYIDSGNLFSYVIIKGNSYAEKRYALNRMVKKVLEIIDTDDVIIADGEAYWTLKAALKTRNTKGNTVVALITDFPNNVYAYSSNINQQNIILRNIKKLYAKSKLNTFRKADAYILLTQQMREVVAKKKPWIVIEGFTDINLLTNDYKSRTSKKKNIVYLGALNGKSGILKLVQAIQKINREDIELHVYGKGEYVESIKKFALEDSRIKYCGVTSLESVMEIEQRAYLLINPRPSNQNFNKYSFPSKTLEYMSSGTPVITTKLAGIPTEYNEYLYFFNDYNAESMAVELTDIIDKDEIELIDIGSKARSYVLTYKNNVVQAKKIIDFIFSLTKAK